MNSLQKFMSERPYAFALLLSILLLIANIVVSPNFLAPSNIPGLLTTLAPFVLVGFASTPSILSGGIDISVGPLATFVSCVLVAVLFPVGLGDWYIAIPLTLLLATGIGALNGVFVAMLRINPVLSSTGMLFLLIGLSLTVSPSPESAPAGNWTKLLAGTIGVVPGAIFTMLVAAAVWFFLRRSAYVRNLVATGDSDISAFGSGVNITVVRVTAYALGGLFAGFAGIALTAMLQSSQPNQAGTYALLGLAAAILGGTALGGGRGGLLGTFLGATAIYLLQQLLTAAGVAPSLIQLSYGVVLVVGVALGATILNSEGRRRKA